MQIRIHQIGPGMVQQIQSVFMEYQAMENGSLVKIDVKAAVEGKKKLQFKRRFRNSY